MKKKIFRLLVIWGMMLMFSGCSFVGATRGGLCAASLLVFLSLAAIPYLAVSQKK
ncbi:MAG: hypothetical protein ACXVP0_05115 [Bacteroidia bacterium]